MTSLGILGKHHEVGVAYDSKVTFCCGKVSLAKRERSQELEFCLVKEFSGLLIQITFQTDASQRLIKM